MNNELRIKGLASLGRSIIHYSLFTIHFALFIGVALFIRAPSVHAAPQHNVSGWAWTTEAGWISTNSTNCFALNQTIDPDVCVLGGIPEANGYGVHITDRGALTGWAWSRVVGWMCLGTTCTGTGGETPNGGWRAQVNAVTGEVIGWAKILALGENSWVAFSCENTKTCGTIAYRTTVDIASGQFSGHAWNGAREGSALGWISWQPTFGGVQTSWRPIPLCSKSGKSCTSNIDCILPGEFCCPAGMPCGLCGGNGNECGSSAECGAGVLCCPNGAQCGQCVGDGSACGGDAQCNPTARDACCPPGAVCTRGNQPPPVDGVLPSGSQVPIIGVCRGSPESPNLCVAEEQCGGQPCEFGRGICPDDSPGGTVGHACGQPNNPNSGCGGQDCKYDFGIWDNQGLRSEDQPNGQSTPCASEDDPHCRRIIGKCTNAEQLCVIDENCPAGSQCGKLFLPWLETKYGSIYSRGNVGNSQTPSPPSGKQNATFCVLAGGSIINFTSGQCGTGSVSQQYFPGYAFPNMPPYIQRPLRVDTQRILKEARRQISALPWSASRSGGKVTVVGSSGAFNGKIFLIEGQDLEIGDSGISFPNNGGAGLMVVRGGNLRVRGNVQYDASPPGDTIASPGFLVLKGEDGGGGNMIIEPGVTNIVGAYYIEGEVHTGSVGSRADQQLHISGAMIAGKFSFERLYATGAAAEVIEADGRLLLNPPPGFADFAKALPIIQQTVSTP